VGNDRQQVVIVTGSSAGYGWQTAVELARRGHWTFASMRDPEGRNAPKAAELKRIAAEEGLTLNVVALDVTDDDSTGHAVREVLAAAGRVDGLVNNAGFGVIGPWETITVEQAEDQFAVNFFGPFRASKAVVPAMRDQHSGTIVNICSESGIRPVPFEAAYAPSKAALASLTEVMRYELQQFGIRCCCVHPGWYGDTEWDLRQVSTVDWDEPAEPYTSLVRQFSAAQGEKEGPQENTGQVARAVADVIEASAPQLHTCVGCSDLRTRPYQEPADFEAAMFSFYEIESLRGPWATRD
jgi:NAD(P)-dependent dehydrogenase (short-subunit alcohol dehydrogenase family)